MVVNTKKCFDCKIEKPVEDFYKTKTTNHGLKDGYYYICNDCLVERYGDSLNKDVAKFLYTVDLPLLKEAWKTALNRKKPTITEYLKIMGQVKYRKLGYADSEVQPEFPKTDDIILKDEYLAFDKDDRDKKEKIDKVDDLFNEGSGSKFIFDNNNNRIELTESLKRKWLMKDSSFSDEEILELEKYFVDMKNDYSIEDASATNLLNELAVLSIKKSRALRENQISDYDKLDRSFQNKLRDSGFRPIDKKDSSEKTGVTSFGQIVAQIERDSGFIPPRIVPVEPDDIDKMLTWYVQWAQRHTNQAVDAEVNHSWRDEVDSGDIDFKVHDTSEGEPDIVVENDEE